MPRSEVAPTADQAFAAPRPSKHAAEVAGASGGRAALSPRRRADAGPCRKPPAEPAATEAAAARLKPRRAAASRGRAAELPPNRAMPPKPAEPRRSAEAPRRAGAGRGLAPRRAFTRSAVRVTSAIATAISRPQAEGGAGCAAKPATPRRARAEGAAPSRRRAHREVGKPREGRKAPRRRRGQRRAARGTRQSRRRRSSRGQGPRRSGAASAAARWGRSERASAATATRRPRQGRATSATAVPRIARMRPAPTRATDRPADPNSPFAKLAALKEQLAAQGLMIRQRVTPLERQRLDKWLWHARVVKARTSAAGLVESGHVRINGVREKSPGHAVKTGDVITIGLDRTCAC